MAETSNTWKSIASAPQGVTVLTKIDDFKGERNVQKLTRRGRLWFVDDDYSMYVYYEPTHWKEVEESETTNR